MSVCMTPAGVVFSMHDSCRSQVSQCMTPAGVKYVSIMTPAGVKYPNA